MVYSSVRILVFSVKMKANVDMGWREHDEERDILLSQFLNKDNMSVHSLRPSDAFMRQ